MSRSVLAGLCTCSFSQAGLAQEVNPATVLPAVKVVAVAPGILERTDGRWLPHQVQDVDDAQLAQARGGSVADSLDRAVAGVGLSAVQGNPWQPDLQYRGFLASPVLGTAQGIAVYQDGVRLNEVFGDTVGWDLVPARALDSATLASGAALAGQNALGGSVDLRSKTGFTAPGTELGVEGGSWGRRSRFVDSGGNDGKLGYYVLADRINEGGWRDASPSELRHETGVVSYRGAATTIDFHLAHADTRLTGNGASPAAWLQQNRRVIFTAPDNTDNRLAQASVSATHRWYADTTASVTLYSRRVRTATYNGDISEYAACAVDPGSLCDDDGSVVGPAGYDAIANAGLRRQQATGGNVALRSSSTWAGLTHHWLLGVELRHGALSYVSMQQLGELDAVRRVAALGPVVDDAAVAAAATTVDRSVFVHDTVGLGQSWSLDLGLRFNRSSVAIGDRSGMNAALDGNHAFARLNPAIGLTWSPRAALTTYLSYTETTRVPTPVELTCADPDAPCRLPNDFVSDPALHQVVARSAEAGMRGNARGMRWTVAAFRTTSAHDILFQATGGAQSNQGFFANVGTTRREGLEATLAGGAGPWRWRASYSFLRAVYLSAFREDSANHPDADPGGQIAVAPGDRIPGLPRNNLRLSLERQLVASIWAGIEGRYVSGQFLRGDESNQLKPTGGYVVIDASLQWAPSPRWEVSFRVDNLLDRHYATFGTLGDVSELGSVGQGPRFVGPGAPRATWAALTVHL